MTLKQYENYKPSGVEWLGEIPKHWEATHSKRICKKITDGAHTSPDLSSPDYPFLSVVNLNKGELDFVNCHYTSKNDYIYLVRNGCNPKIGNVLFSKDGTIGESILIKDNIEFVVGSSFIITKPNNNVIQSNYFQYFLSSSFIKDKARVFVKGTGIPRLSIFNFSRLEITVPSISEQTAIAHYLDQKTTAIDRKIDLLEKKIDRYQALRKSLINETVCRGLDKSVKLKESGIEWIGQVPEHWQPVRLKDIGFLYSGLSGKSGDDFNQEDNPNNKGFIPFTNIANNIYLDKNQLGTVLVFDNEKQNQVRKNDLFFLMSSEGYADIGKTAVLADEINETYLNSFCKGFRVSNKKYDSYFINYLLLSPNYRHSMIVEGKGFTRINLKMEKVNDYFIYAPPTKTEQTAIATYLEGKTQKIDTIIGNIKKQIEMLKELRKTLINDVVTGKIRVNN